MKSKPGKAWKSETLRMADHHGWRAPAGYKIVVVDRGAISFNVPVKWVLAELEPTMVLYDKKPPRDDARLSITSMRMPIGTRWFEVPVEKFLVDSIEQSHETMLERGPVQTELRGDLKLAWTQVLFMDPKEHREAYTRTAVAVSWASQVVISCDFWVTDEPRIVPVWDEVIRSLQMGRYIEDPTKGPTLQ